MPEPSGEHCRRPSVQKSLAGGLPLRARRTKSIRREAEPWRTVAVAAAVPLRAIRLAIFFLTVSFTVVRLPVQR